MQNIINTLADSTTADTSHGSTLRFQHVEGAWSQEDLEDVRRPTRKFMISPTGARALIGFLGQESEMTSVEQVFDLSVAYKQGRSAFQLMQVVAEDVDQIGRMLMKTAHFDASNTGLERRRVESYSIIFDETSGGTALLTIPIVCRYTPTYS